MPPATPTRLLVTAALVAILAVLPGSGRSVAGRSRPDRPSAPPHSNATAALHRSIGAPKVLEMQAGELLPAALVRAGLSQADAERAAAALADEFDTVNPHPGLRLQLATYMSGPTAPPQLAVLSLDPRPDTHLTLHGEPSGALALSRADDPVFAGADQIAGAVDGSLYLSLVAVGASPDTAAQVTRAFGRTLDLSRDVETGDRFRLVFEQRRRAGGEALGPRELIYAEVVTRAGAARIYRDSVGGIGTSEFADGEAGPSGVLLLRTPVDGSRLSSGFGWRMHPILGFTRMHEGVDFAAAPGTPVLAAGDGVVEEARWSGGYGRWLKIRHAAGLETGYGHLQAWAVGVAPGASVRQGQVVAFVGASGLATGPHLHFEVFRAGRRVNPASATGVSLAQSSAAGPSEQFRAQRAAIDAIVASLAAPNVFDSASGPSFAPMAPG